MSRATSEATTNEKTSLGPKPHFAFLIASGLGLGYLPLTPGTWGSLLGILLGWIALHAAGWGFSLVASPALNFGIIELIFTVIVSVLGVWAATRASNYALKHDPQFIVVDEVAGQLISYLGLATTRTFGTSWKYLLFGFVAFRLLDVWKPAPARQAESLPDGWGIMADDWMAGVYAAILLGAVRALGF